MGVTREELEGMSDRRLECLLAQIFHRHDKLQEFKVRGEYLCDSRARQDDDPSVRGIPIPRYVATWDGFGQALEGIDHCNFNVEMHCPAERLAPRRAIVTQRLNEKVARAEASHAELRRALALAAALVMYEWWYEKD
jgi:hypothetical protein